jgi:hypothetical protein
LHYSLLLLGYFPTLHLWKVRGSRGVQELISYNLQRTHHDGRSKEHFHQLIPLQYYSTTVLWFL